MRCRICGADLPDGAMFCGECGSSTSATPESRRRADPRAGDTTMLDRHALSTGVVSVPVPVPEAAGATVGSGPTDGTGVPLPEVAEAMDGAAESRPTFTLRFSTGEVRTVSGSGLVGRKPLPQPGETFDQLVQIADRTLSVSKTHLEFGEHDGDLWVADRFSGNGTIVRRDGTAAVRCEPGRRYLVPRGSVVELAGQSFTVE